MKQVGKIIVATCAIPLIVVAVVLFLPFILIMQAKAAISLRVFRRREAGHVFLICTSRRNWHDFLNNNVIPVLPDNFRVVWHKSVCGGEYSGLMRHLTQSHIFGVPKPYIVAVSPRALLHRSLNSALQELKTHPKKSKDTQQACLDIINKELIELRTMP